MSTNAHIIFEHEDRQVKTYKHWDGYPDSTLPLLREFLEWMPDGRYKQLDYTSATWFYWVKSRGEDRDLSDTPDHNDDRVLSYGIVPRNSLPSAHIEHTYVVDLAERQIKHYRGGSVKDIPDTIQGF